MNREDKSEVLDQALNLTNKKAFSFDRVNLGFKKDDPFEDKVSVDVWMIKGDKLLKNKKYGDGK